MNQSHEFHLNEVITFRLYVMPATPISAYHFMDV